MNSPDKYHVYAASLLADLEGVAARNLPRREILADWLRDFIRRSAGRGFSIVPAEVTDLMAVHDHLAAGLVAPTRRPALV